MARCTKIRRPQREVCIGDLRDRIIIQTRAIAAPIAGSVDFSETFACDSKPWALVKTVRGTQVFDGVNIIGVATHEIYIRYICGVTFENWLTFKGNKYEILGVENLEERDEFFLFRCSLAGKENITTNFSR